MMSPRTAKRLGVALIAAPAFFLNGCTAGSLPAQGQLPVLDGSALTNVNASKVGALGSTDVVAGITAVTAATDSPTASALVKRDGQGNFSAGTITASLIGNATNVTGVVAVANGGTGAATAPAALTALGAAPSYASAYAENNIFQSTSAAIPRTDVIPLATQGIQILSATITPVRSTDRLWIRAEIPYTAGGPNMTAAALFQDSIANALTATASAPTASGFFQNLSLVHQMIAGTTNPILFMVRVGVTDSAYTMYLNGLPPGSGGRIFGGAIKSTLTVQEFGP